MGPLFSLRSRAPSPTPAASCGLVGRGKGVRTPARPRRALPSASWRRWGLGVSVTRRTLSARPPPPVFGCLAGRPLLLPGEGPPSCRVARLACRTALRGAPGAFRVVSQVPEAEPVLSFPVPDRDPPAGSPPWWSSGVEPGDGEGLEKRGTPALLAWRGAGCPRRLSPAASAGAGLRLGVRAGAEPTLVGCCFFFFFWNLECRRVFSFSSRRPFAVS